MSNQVTNLHLIKKHIILEKKHFYALFAVLLWILRIPLTIPSLSADRGVYVSSAERLLAGDKLYSEIFEAKDPIFIWQINCSQILTKRTQNSRIPCLPNLRRIAAPAAYRAICDSNSGARQ